MKKIVLPVRDGRIDDHFGHCEHYSIVSVDDSGKIIGIEDMPSPQGCGCKSGVAAVFKEKGITVMLAGNMGAGALNKLSENGLTVIRGCSGPVMDVVNDYLAGRLRDSGESCRNHEHHDGDGHSCHGKDEHSCHEKDGHEGHSCNGGSGGWHVV